MPRLFQAKDLAMRTCSKCGAVKGREHFVIASKNHNRLRNICRACKRAYDLAYMKDPVRQAKRRTQIALWYLTARGRALTKRQNVKAHSRKLMWQWDLRERVINKYGSACNCCGETLRPFLTIDHVNNDGAAERRRLASRAALLKRLLAEPLNPHYQLLCFNCNSGRHLNGGVCPHVETLHEVIGHAS